MYEYVPKCMVISRSQDIGAVPEVFDSQRLGLYMPLSLKLCRPRDITVLRGRHVLSTARVALISERASERDTRRLARRRYVPAKVVVFSARHLTTNETRKGKEAGWVARWR